MARRLAGPQRMIKDPIHDYIEFGPRVWAVIDTPQFQRLRRIKQLGTSYYVWSGASHNRFEHCLGVAYLARQVAEKLQHSQPELGITDQDVDCVELAGLCHDLGHGPWSHVWDTLFIPTALKGKRWKHEDASEMMLDDLVAKNGHKVDIEPADLEFIKALIAGDTTRGHCPPQKHFLFDIVANRRNGIDVDKFDYMMRDQRAIGEDPPGLSRLVKSVRAIDNQICYDIKDIYLVEKIGKTRFFLHKSIYNHKTAKAIEYMIMDAILLAEPHLQIAEQVDNPNKYLHLTDEIKGAIEASDDPKLAEAKALFMRIAQRDLYRRVDFKLLPWELRDIIKMHVTPEAIVEAAKALPPAADMQPQPVHGNDHYSTPDDDEVSVDETFEAGRVEDLHAKHVIVDFAPLHCGMQDKNPVDSIRFYSKHLPNVCMQAQPGELSTITQSSYAEILLRVYTRDIRYYGIIQAGYRALMNTLPSRVTRAQATVEDAAIPTTPPATEAASSPTPNGSFANNSFTTVDRGYVPASPAQNRPGRTPRTGMRTRRRREEEPSPTPTPTKRVRREVGGT